MTIKTCTYLQEKKFCNMKLMLQNGDAEYCTKNKTIESVVMKSPHLSSNAGPYLSDWISSTFRLHVWHHCLLILVDGG